MPPKDILRGEIKSRLKEVKREEFKIQGAGAAALIRASLIWESFDTFFLFLSTNSEIDTQPLLESALKDGKKVFVPKVYAEKLVFNNVASAEGPWEKGAFGIREPAGGGEPPAAPEDFPALIVVPGRAFDRNGNRLGKGGGYYDRFLGELDTEGRLYNTLGLCMDFQIVGSVPVGEKDKKMDWVITQNEINSSALKGWKLNPSEQIKEV
jgi:5-formyltetrahydrofolate cyclo-ligase